MSAIARTFGALVLLLGILLLVAGVGAAVYGAMDAQDQEEERGPFGIGEDPERTEQNQVLVAGGLAAAGLGLLLSIVGIVLLVVQRGRQQQQVVVAETGAVSLAGDSSVVSGQQQAPQRMHVAVWGAAAVVVLGLVLLGAALTGSVPGTGQEASGPLDRRSYDRSIAMAGSLGGQGHGSDSFEVVAPAGARFVRIVADWEPTTDQSDRLQVSVQTLVGSQWQSLRTAPLAPGGILDVDGALDGARVRFVVGPVDQRLVLTQDYTLDVAFYR